MTGAYTERIEQDKRTGTQFDNYWVMKDIDIDKEPMRLQNILQSVFSNLAMKCVIAESHMRSGQMSSWLAKLRELRNLHFDTSSEGIARHAHWRSLDLTSMIPGEPPITKPPDYIFDLVPENEHILAFDIETHDFVPNSKRSGPEWIQGQYGHPCRFQSQCLEQLRIVQLGWCIYKPTGQPLSEKTQFVYPTDFEVTKVAQCKHRITNDQLRDSGKPLRSVLEEFLHDVLDIVNTGGSVCAHQMEFDAGIIALEMERAGLEHKQDMWAQAVTEGFCTMNHHVSKWSCRTYFDQVGCDGYLGRNSPVGLHDMVLALVLEEYRLLQRHHDAGVDAKMTMKIMHALQHMVAQFR
jgi:DNA polymerase III epsilon subunit-like protein